MPQLELIDTQIISYALKGTGEALDRTRQGIPSIAAREFLESCAEEPTDARYLVPIRSQCHTLGTFRAHLEGPPRAFRRAMTDQQLFNLGTYGGWIDYGNFAIAAVVNERNAELFHVAIAHLPKEDRKRIKRRFKFLLDTGLPCVPMTASACELVPELFALFTSTNTPKQNLRNTLNDVMLLAAAQDAGNRLRTDDVLLRRFAQQIMGAGCAATAAAFLLDFGERAQSGEDASRESKGYINRPWLNRLRNPMPPEQ